MILRRYEDFDPSNFEPPDVLEGETYITNDKIVRIKDGGMFVGQTDYAGLPHGHGYLMLCDGAQHVGHFEKVLCCNHGTILTSGALSGVGACDGCWDGSGSKWDSL